MLDNPVQKFVIRSLLLFSVWLSTSCTTINTHVIPSEIPTEISVGIYMDTELDVPRTKALLADVQEYFRITEGVSITWVQLGLWERCCFGHRCVLNRVWKADMRGTDALMVLLGRDSGDFIWGIIMPEVYGAVFKGKHNRGFAVVEWGSLNQILNFASPRRMLIHEMYHILGYTD